MSLVEAADTHLTPEVAIEAFAYAHLKVMGQLPTPGALACFVAQSALETGNWQHMKNYNFGNIKPPTDWDGDVTMFRCNELIRGKYEWFDPPHPQTRFVAFKDAAEGAAYQLTFLATRERYEFAWHWACAGSPDPFVRALHMAGYFTAKVEPYVRAVVAIWHKLLEPCAAWLRGDGHLIDDELREHVGAVVALTLFDARMRGEELLRMAA